MSLEVWATRNACGVWGGENRAFALCISWRERFIRLAFGTHEWAWGV